MTEMTLLREHVTRARTGGKGRYFVGIDLGTTNCSAALVDNDALQKGNLDQAVRLVSVRQQTQAGWIYSPLLPSVVAEAEPGRWRIGQGARELRQRCEIVLENPLCSTRVQGAQERGILELEQEAKRLGETSRATTVTFELAELCFDQSRYERAIDWGRRTLATLGRPEPRILGTMGHAYERLGALDRAEACFREGIAANASSTIPWYSLAMLLQRQDRFDEALHAMDQACRIAPRQGGLRAARGYVLHRQGRHADACADWEQAVRLFDEQDLRDAFDRAWRQSVAEWLGDKPTAEKLALPVEEPPPVGPYDPQKLPAMKAGALVSAGRG